MVEQFGAPESIFMQKDAVSAIAQIMDEYQGKVQCIYMDPPFCTGKDFNYHAKVGELGYKGKSASTVKLLSYNDKIDGYYEYLYQVLKGCHNLLTSSGSLFLHIDYRASARLRLMLDEIFGEDNFLNEIIWCYKTGGRSKRFFSRKHDNILLYSKSKKSKLYMDAVGKPIGQEQRNHLKRSYDEQGKMVMSIKSGGRVYTYTEDSLTYPTDVWHDISHLQQKDPERTGFDTQKPEALLERVIKCSTVPGDIVADFFSGSGTTASVSHRLGRHFIASDISSHAYNLLKKRIACQHIKNLSLCNMTLESSQLFQENCKNILFDIKNTTQGRLLQINGYTLQNAAPPLPTQDTLQYLDYICCGRLDGYIFYPDTASFRSSDNTKLDLELNLNNENNAFTFCDCLGNCGIVQL